jgi:hypothetical protein
MRRLGYTRYVAQGGDQGAAVTDSMGRDGAEGLVGIHLNLLAAGLGGSFAGDSEEERSAADAVATFRKSGYGYFLEQATRPQTIGYCAPRFTRRAGGLAARPRHRQLLQDLPRIPRGEAIGESTSTSSPRKASSRQPGCKNESTLRS